MSTVPTEVAAGSIKRIHVNRQKIARNRKSPDREAALTCKVSRSNLYGNTITIDGPSRLVYKPDQPLPCGAVAWIETKARVIVE